jgi:hypothetical protein
MSKDISSTPTVDFPISFFDGFFLFLGEGHGRTIVNASKSSTNCTTYNSTYLSSSYSASVRGSTKGSPHWLNSEGISIFLSVCLSNSKSISSVVG